MGFLSWFRARGREIFPYRDGTRKRWADPLVVHQKLEKEGGDWQGLLRSLLLAADFKNRPNISPELMAEMNVPALMAGLAATVRKAFDVPPLREDSRGRPVGLADAECLSLLADFMSWLADLEAEYLPLPPLLKAAPLPSAEVETGEWITGRSAPSTLPETASV